MPEITSLKEKLHKSFNLTNQIADLIDGEEFVDEVYGYADGLMVDYFDRMINGRCSIQAMIGF